MMRVFLNIFHATNGFASKNSFHSESSPAPEKNGDSSSHNYSIRLVVLAAFLSFIVSIDGDFVFDDAETVVRNRVVNGKIPIYEVSQLQQ